MDGQLAVRVLLTGGTGFVGQEILWQVAHDPDIAEVVVLIRPKEIKDRKTGKVTRGPFSPPLRGEQLLAAASGWRAPTKRKNSVSSPATSKSPTWEFRRRISRS